MKIKSLFLASICALTFQSQANAAGKVYGRMDVGLGMPLTLKDSVARDVGYKDTKPGTGFMYNFGVGVDSGAHLRGEFNITTLEQIKFAPTDTMKLATPSITGTASQKIGSTVATANLYFDLGNFNSFKPYIGGGVGIAMNNVGDFVLSDNAAAKTVSTLTYDPIALNNMAFELGIGGAYAVTEAMSLDLSYVYTDMGRLKTGNALYEKMGGAVSQAVASTALDTKLSAHTIKLGLRLAF